MCELEVQSQESGVRVRVLSPQPLAASLPTQSHSLPPPRSYTTFVRELTLLHHIYARSMELPSQVTIPPGDDMGAVTIGGTSVLVTVDQLADGVHFLLGTTPLAKVARKAITRNLSDVAAMGAVPSAAVVAGSFPRGFDQSQAAALFDAMRATALAYDCPIIGGDTSIWDHPMLLTVTILADMQGAAPLLRSGARPGDVICVTGMLGGSLVELDDPPGYVHHLDFEPRLAVGRKLATDAALRPRCMLDLSDGLAQDLPRLCEMGEAGGAGKAGGAGEPGSRSSSSSSGSSSSSSRFPVSAELWVDALPISLAAHTASIADGRAPWQHALGDGEDYELCFIVSPEVAAAMPKLIEGVPVTQIGKIIPREAEPVMLRMPDGTRQAMREKGWEHGASAG